MRPQNLAEKTREALRLQRAGQIERARAAYERILEQAARNAPVLNGLSLIRLAVS